MADESMEFDYPSTTNILGFQIDVDYTEPDDNGQVMAEADFQWGGDDIHIQTQPEWPPSEAFDLLESEIVKAVESKPNFVKGRMSISPEISLDSQHSIFGKLPAFEAIIELGIVLVEPLTWEVWVHSMVVNGQPRAVPEGLRQNEDDTISMSDAQPGEALNEMFTELFNKLIESEKN